MARSRARCRRAAQDPRASEAQRVALRLARARRMPTTPRRPTTAASAKFRSAMTHGAAGRRRWRKARAPFGAMQAAHARSARSRAAAIAGPCRDGDYRAAASSAPSFAASAMTRDGDGDAGARGRRRVARRRLLDPLARHGAAPTPHERNRRDLQVRLPGVRRRGDLESGQAEARSARSAAPSRRPSSTSTTGGIVEHDLVAALRGITDDARGWKADKRQVKCQSCNAISVFDPKRQAQNCEFCGSAQLVPYEETKPAFRPGERAAVRGQRERRRAIASGSGTASCGSRPTRSSAAR